MEGQEPTSRDMTTPLRLRLHSAHTLTVRKMNMKTIEVDLNNLDIKK